MALACSTFVLFKLFPAVVGFFQLAGDLLRALVVGLEHYGRHLLRVVVKEDATAYAIITAYKTSKVDKYWKQP